MSGTTKLKQYNKALDAIGTQSLHTVNGLTEDTPARYKLDEHYDDSVQYMLELGLWKFALKSVELLPDTSVAPVFGPTFAYTIPGDFVRLHGFASDGEFRAEVPGYREENGLWLTNTNPIFVSYVSNDSNHGLNLAKWPQNFAVAHGIYLGLETGLPITRDKVTRQDLEGRHMRSLSVSKRLDAVDESVKRKPIGSVIRSRFANNLRGTTRGLN